MKILEESINNMDSKIGKLASFKGISIKCNSDQLIEQVRNLGEIVDESGYAQKLKAVKVVTEYKPFELIPRYENKKFARLNRLHLNKHLLYVFCTDSSKKDLPLLCPIAVFKAESFFFLRKFGMKGYLTSCMTVGDEFIYVGHTLHSQHHRQRITNHRLILYKLSDFSFVKEGKIPEGLCPYDIGFTHHQVLVLCSQESCVKSLIYDRSLNFLGEVVVRDQFTKSLIDIPTRFIGNRLFVLYEKELRVFSISKENKYSTEKGKRCDWYVCVLNYVCLFSDKVDRKESAVILCG